MCNSASFAIKQSLVNVAFRASVHDDCVSLERGLMLNLVGLLMSTDEQR